MDRGDLNPNEGQIIVSVDEVTEFIERCMRHVGVKPEHASALAKTLIAADTRGHYSHGLNRLAMYMDDVSLQATAVDKEPLLISENAATAYVDGQNTLGPVVGNFCMRLAIEKAREVGVGWVVAKGSNHYGIAGWYSMQASAAGFLGMSFTNTTPCMIPTRAKRPTLGTNPISLAAPTKSGKDFVLDMATTSVSLGKVEINQIKGMPIPSGWGADCNGEDTLDPTAVVEDGGLLPLGGREISSGYKGYGLAMLVEIFCGILGGASYGPNIRHWRNREQDADLGHCFIAVDPNCFAPGFVERMDDLNETMRNLNPAEDETEVLVAGDLARRHEELIKTLPGIPYDIRQIEIANETAARHNLPPLKTLT